MLRKPFKKLRDKNGKYIRDEFGRYKYSLRLLTGGRGTRLVNRRLFLKDDLEAAKEAARLRGDCQIDSGKYTWDEAYKLFGESKTTLTKDYLKVVGVAVDYIRDRTNQCIEKTTLAAYTAALREKATKTSGRRANNIRIYTRSVARFARGEGMIREIPFDNAPARPENKTGRKPFPLERVAEYYTAMDEYARPLFTALTATGERVSALCGIDVQDIQAGNGIVTVTKKGGKQRDIPISKALSEALLAALSLTPPNGRKEEGAVFVNRAGTRWNRYTFHRNATRAWKTAKLPPQTVHSIRNMMASEMADANTSGDIISASLGHDQTATADIYVKAREKLRAAEAGLTTWSDTLLKALHP